jgi:hypothetical protein
MLLNCTSDCDIMLEDTMDDVRSLIDGENFMSFETAQKSDKIELMSCSVV